MTIYRLTGRTGPIPVEVEHQGGRFLLIVDPLYLQLAAPCTWSGCTRPAEFAEPATDDGTSPETELMCSEHIVATPCECQSGRIATHTVAHDCAGDGLPWCSADVPCGERLYRCDECDPDDGDAAADRRPLEPLELPR